VSNKIQSLECGFSLDVGKVFLRFNQSYLILLYPPTSYKIIIISSYNPPTHFSIPVTKWDFKL